jgi:hypothetical protein
MYAGNAIKRDTFITTVQKTTQIKKKEWLHLKKTKRIKSVKTKQVSWPLKRQQKFKFVDRQHRHFHTYEEYYERSIQSQRRGDYSSN